MSQIALTGAERQRALQALGYTERQAQFLGLAALHGGYFLRRHYARFLGGQDGGTVSDLIDKALDLGHAEAATFKGNMNIYHLSARPFYAALGQEDNRNRRRKEVSTIKEKLMALDFVLDHPAPHYLTTEQEKTQFFVKEMGVDPAGLPGKRYASRGDVTERYFVEKYPIFWRASLQPATPPVVSFCFVDPGQASLDGFETFLRRYCGLFTSLRQFEVVYVAAHSGLFEKAEATFERFRRGGLNTGNAIAPEQIQDYFEIRRLYETKYLSALDRTKLLRLRDLRQAFSGPEIEALYVRWKASGVAALHPFMVAQAAVPDPEASRFSTYFLDYSYDLFGDLTTH